jgi:hypothetical protein
VLLIVAVVEELVLLELEVLEDDLEEELVVLLLAVVLELVDVDVLEFVVVLVEVE